MADCLFCKIAAGDIPSNKLFEDDQLLAFYDIDPQAPVHFLVIPKRHIDSAAVLTEDDAALLGHIYAVIAQLAARLGIAENGYRVVTNVGADGGQSVKHLHFHVLAGRSLAWPPG
ncbi:histidine triad nucleotide-binding protein [uncultured Gemmiger sp.]|uniref:histidine triad nucleotide-binding protein n=1 Tax=uncultured Gemmiger sp. TaxID=1623490 RepID=UPI0027DB3891|nr:histidine triad nucleotide-binding protein [uncultured Gemmiger sp.]